MLARSQWLYDTSRHSVHGKCRNSTARTNSQNDICFIHHQPNWLVTFHWHPLKLILFGWLAGVNLIPLSGSFSTIWRKEKLPGLSWTTTHRDDFVSSTNMKCKYSLLSQKPPVFSIFSPPASSFVWLASTLLLLLPYRHLVFSLLLFYLFLTSSFSSINPLLCTTGSCYI